MYLQDLEQLHDRICLIEENIDLIKHTVGKANLKDGGEGDVDK